MNLSGAQGDALLVRVDTDDLHQHPLTRVEDLRGAKLGSAGHLADVQEPLHAQAQLDEGAEIEHAADLPLDQLSHFVVIGHLRPGVRLQALEAERDAGAVPVQIEDVDLHFVAYLDDLAWIVDLLPGEL